MEPLKAPAATMKMYEEFRVFVRFYSSPFEKAESCLKDLHQMFMFMLCTPMVIGFSFYLKVKNFSFLL